MRTQNTIKRIFTRWPRCGISSRASRKLSVGRGMTKEEIFKEPKAVLVKSFLLDEDDITLEADLYADLDFDSIDDIDVAAMIHNVTGKHLKPEQFKGVRTIGDAVDVIEQLMN